MSGSNGIPRFSLWNREEEFVAPHPLKTRGATFFTVQGASVASTATLTPDQVSQDLVITGAGGGTITWPSSASVLANTSPNSLQQNYGVATNAGWSVTLTNATAAAETLSFPANFVVGGNFSLTLPMTSSRTVNFLIQGTAPSQTIYVY